MAGTLKTLIAQNQESFSFIYQENIDRLGEVIFFGEVPLDRGRRLRVLQLAPGRTVPEREARRRLVQDLRRGERGQGPGRVHAGRREAALRVDRRQDGRLRHAVLTSTRRVRFRDVSRARRT